MVGAVPNSVQDVTHDGGGPKPQNKVLLQAVIVELVKPQRKRSILTVTFGDKRGEKKSEKRKYMSIQWEPGQTWDVTNGGVVTASWKSRCPLKWSRRTNIEIDKILYTLSKGKSTTTSSPAAGTREYNHVYEDRRCKITVKFTILGDPQPKSLPVIIKSTQEDAQKIMSVRSRLGASVTFLEGVLAFGDLVKEVHPIINISIQILSTAIRILDAEDAFNQAAIDLIEGMSDMVDYVADVKQFATIAQLKLVLEEASNLMHSAVGFFNKYKRQGSFGRVFFALSPSTQEELEGLQTNFARFKDKFNRGISIQTMVTTNELNSRLKRHERHFTELERQLKDLVRANDDDKVLEVLDTKHQTRALRCLNGTRVDLISFILEWVRNVETALNILWIYGYPGAGKSTLAMHIADLFRMAHRLGVIVEFNRTTDADAMVLWKTCSLALACEYPECRAVIIEKLKCRTLNLANATSTQIFNELVAEPLKRLTSTGVTVPKGRLPVIVIDALDECGGSGGSSWKAREDILKCFAEWTKLGPGVKLIVTSRVEQDIYQAFSKFPHMSLEIHTGTSTTQTSTRDIELYLEDGFKRIAAVNGITGDWPGNKTIADLSRRAEGVFIWATTVLSFVDDVDPQCQLKMIQEGRFPAGDVYGLYLQILNTSFPSAYNSDKFVLIVESVVVLQKPFTRIELAQLLSIDLGTVNGVCKGLRTVLDEGDVVRFRHQSFVDFLTQPTLSFSDGATACPPRFRINISGAHDRLCKSLFRLMHKELHFNICNIPSSFVRNDELPRGHFESAIGQPLAYACRFWSFHLTNTQSEPKLDLIKTFIHEDLLSWIESLSGLKSLTIAAPSLVSLMVRLSSSSEQATSLKPLVKDAIQFIRYFALAIAQSAAHLYITALTFAPKSSLVSRLYAPRFKNIVYIELGQLDEWPSEQAVIRVHSYRVNFVAFSPNGKQVVSCSDDETVRVSDVETGEIAAGPFKEHKRRVFCAVYSTDGESILSVSDDWIIRKWDVGCGVVDVPIGRVVIPIEEIIGYTNCVTFSRSRKYIAFVRTRFTRHDAHTLQNAIFIRDVETGQAVSGPILGHKNQINCIAFSPDDARVASASSDETFRVCETQTGKLVIETLAGSPVSSISYSHDGAYIALGLGNGTIRLWDVGGTPHQVRVYEGHSAWIYCVAFSSNDRWIVSGSGDRTVRIWDARTGQVVAGPFEGDTFFRTVAFSPDSKRIASGSDDGTVCIWHVEVNATSGERSGGQNGIIGCFALSKDSRRIVSGSDNGTIRIWDTRTGQLVGGPFKVHESEVNSVAYSPDNEKVASGSSDGKIRVWDVQTEETVMELDSNTGSVGSVVYSNNGRYLASTLYSQDLSVNRVWDVVTGECTHTLQVVSRAGQGSIAFSADDGHIVSDSKTGLVFRIWNVKTGKLVTESDSQADEYFASVTLSHDGKLIATGSLNGIRLWDAATGKSLLGPFNSYTSRVFSVAFSSDDKFIVSGSDDKTVRVWEVKTGHAIMGPFHGHAGTIHSVSFTHDDKYVISGSRDGTIRIWPMEQTQRSPFTDQSEIDRDGWVKDANGGLLFWVPLRQRANLHRPGNSWIIAPYSTRLNLGNARWGKDWTECYAP